jgi:alkanesulfonate monooxygenase SsuD/methylene tetrahydromethanopterin reductase-like flavin-dependent oxidoreductase (luciferase family)
LGYDSAWFSEHHSGPYSFGNPALMIATAATRTKRLKLGTGVSLVPLHHPLMLSEEYAMLDQLTAGRLEYGVGRGLLFHEYPWMGVSLGESSARQREAVDFIIKAWTADGPISFQGEFFKIDNYRHFPGVVQKPHPPIYMSTVSPETYVLAGSKNLDIGIVLFAPGIEAVPANISNYRQALRANGFDPSAREVMGITQMYCAGSQKEALEEGRKYAENYHRFVSGTISAVAGPNEPFAKILSRVDSLEQNARNQALFGCPESLIEKIGRMRDEWHIDYLQLEVAQGGLGADQVKEVLRLFAEKVIPHFK